ncbi:MAG: hypothetical protein M3P27_02890 [Acidobacteriota bacterium]|nr:hypothetical protein [Acidobacteriota bacterium]
MQTIFHDYETEHTEEPQASILRPEGNPSDSAQYIVNKILLWFFLVPLGGWLIYLLIR